MHDSRYADESCCMVQVSSAGTHSQHAEEVAKASPTKLAAVEASKSAARCHNSNGLASREEEETAATSQTAEAEGVHGKPAAFIATGYLRLSLLLVTTRLPDLAHLCMLCGSTHT